MTFDKTIPMLRQIGRYQLVKEIGRGSMGIVYEAFDPKLERTVALKTVRLEPGNPEHREFEERFQREGKSAAGLNHPNIVTIYDAGEENDVAYIAMEFLEGKSLRDILDEGVYLPLEERIRYGIQMAEAIDYAHRYGIVHRDIKPANIVISSAGLLKVSDFGIAQIPAGNLTQTGAVLGTPKYMSPEQVRGERVDGRSDIFSLGIILYELFAGKAPFSGENLAVIMYQIMNTTPADPATENPGCPAGVGPIIARCLAKDKLERYPRAGEIATDLRRLMQVGSASVPRTPAALEKTRPSGLFTALGEKTLAIRGIRRKWSLITGSVTLLVLLAGLGVWKVATPFPETSAALGGPAPTTEPLPSKTDTPRVLAPSESASAPTKKTAKTVAKPKKGFWRRQVDCIKRGVCDKPKQSSKSS